MPICRFDIQPLTDDLAKQSTILVPNHRIRDAILDSYSSKLHRSTWLTPKVFAIDIWLRELWNTAASHGISPFTDIYILEGYEELLLWTGIIEKSLPQIPLINPEETAVEVQRAYQQLRLWFEGTGIENKLALFTEQPDIPAFEQWKKKFLANCGKKQVAPLVDCTGIIVNSIDKLKSLLPRKLVLVGFFTPPPLYQRLFRQLESLGTSTSIPCNFPEFIPSKARYHFSDAISEFNACANWAKQLIENDPMSHVGIVCNGNEQTRHELERTFSQQLYPLALPDLEDTKTVFNSSSAIESFFASPLVHDAFLLLGLNDENQQSDNLCRLLQTPHTGSFEAEREARLQMQLFMRKNYSTTATVAEFIRHLSQTEHLFYCPQLAQSILAIRSRHRSYRGHNNSINWAALFSEQLAIMGWPGNRDDLTVGERNTLREWEKVLAKFTAANLILGKMTFSAALSRLRLLCARHSAAPVFLPSNPLSLFTLNEAVGLRFDHVWMLGFDDQSWPPAPRPSSFLPFSLQRDAGIPDSSSELQLQHASAGFKQLCASVTTNLIGSFHAVEEDQQLRPSLAIQGFPLQDNKIFYCQSDDTSFIQKRESAFITVQDCEAFPLLADEAPRGGHSVISNQSSCPFRAFTKHRLHASPLEEFVNGLSSAARGSAIHLALERLYQDIESKQTLLAMSEPERERITAQSATLAIDYLCSKFRHTMTPRFQAIEKQRIESLLRRFLELEKSRSDFRVLAREQTERWESGELTLKLKIDRIDVLDDGTLLLIDYKSGKHTGSVSSLTDERPEDMQLPVYVSAIAPLQKSPVSGIGIAHINIENTDYSGICAGENFHPSIKPVHQDKKLDSNWIELSESWQIKVTEFANEFCTGIARVSPAKNPTTCRYCGLQSLCRIGELNASENLNAEDGDDE